jgi:hypothetical protein
MRKDKQKSLKLHTKPCMFLGIPDGLRGWKLWNLLVQGGRSGVIISCKVVWNMDSNPARFGCPANAELVPEAPEHKEIEDNSDSPADKIRLSEQSRQLAEVG